MCALVLSSFSYFQCFGLLYVMCITEMSFAEMVDKMLFICFKDLIIQKLGIYTYSGFGFVFLSGLGYIIDRHYVFACEHHRIIAKITGSWLFFILSKLYSILILSPFKLSSFFVLILLFFFFITAQLVDHIPEIDSPSIVMYQCWVCSS